MNPSYQTFATHNESDYPELWEGCVGAWAPCLGPSGTRLHDLSGKANWGTLTNMDAATDWVVDGGHYALDFDGSNDYVDCGTFPGFQSGDSFSVAGWINVNSVVANAGIVVGDRQGVPGIGQNGWHLRLLAGGAIRWIVYSNGGDFRGADSAALTPGKWSFFCGTITQLSVSLRVDSTSYAQSVVAGTFPNITGTFPLWLSRYTAYLNGKIDDVKIWKRKVSEPEQSILFEIGRGGMYTPRRRRKVYFFGPSFSPAWARGSNVILQPAMGVG